MQESTPKIWCKTIYLADIPLEIFMISDGGCYLSQAQVFEAISQDDSGDLEEGMYNLTLLQPNSIRPGSSSKYFKALFDNGFELDQAQGKLDLESACLPINPVSFDVACLYWHKSAMAGNEKAQVLVAAMMNRTICRLADQAFDPAKN
ncbi:MAG: hypothetical protein QNJ32_30665 [Xenococcaceae cyanobacterium MO_167.B27]|nr:hypothetical protein [Xenococcaceae cyanobacterium MO_167.B27]